MVSTRLTFKETPNFFPKLVVIEIYSVFFFFLVILDKWKEILASLHLTIEPSLHFFLYSLGNVSLHLLQVF